MGKQRTIFHIDVNSAYLSWTAVYQLQHGAKTDLREIPSVIGGDPKTRHGIVLAKSIPAKEYNIQTGESLYAARQKCPGLTVASPDYSLYIKCSNAMMEILNEYSPLVQRFSVDEVFLDYTDMEYHFGPPVSAANNIKERIKKQLGFTVNIGISTNKLLAKIASDLKKPDRVHTLFEDEIPQKMWPLPVRDLFMVGRATTPKLHRLGIHTIGDLANYDPDTIKYRLKKHGLLIWNYANGRDDSSVRASNHINMKGIGNSTTIPFDVEDSKTAHLVLLSLTETASARLRDAQCCCKLVVVSIRTDNFRSYSHQRKLPVPTDTTNSIYITAKELFDEAWEGEPVRNLGVRLSELCTNEFYQTSFFDETDLEKKRSLDRTIDSIRSKYGSGSVIRSSFLHSGIKPLLGGVGPDGYPVMTSLL